ncbi:MAG: membrane protein insertion efficiency factor YidD [Candidatus Omnitrophica bacterium]|nr:membrane protein insertion efficiency factor YidD [Candidatus Omnitrophota bacterium]
MKRFIRSIITCYQKVSRCLWPRCCRFYPSCSQYTLEAIEKYGVIKGLLKAIGRISRCSPLSHGGYDPLR